MLSVLTDMGTSGLVISCLTDSYVTLSSVSVSWQGQTSLPHPITTGMLLLHIGYWYCLDTMPKQPDLKLQLLLYSWSWIEILRTGIISVEVKWQWPGITLLCNRQYLPGLIYRLFVPLTVNALRVTSRVHQLYFWLCRTGLCSFPLSVFLRGISSGIAIRAHNTITAQTGLVCGSLMVEQW